MRLYMAKGLFLGTGGVLGIMECSRWELPHAQSTTVPDQDPSV